MRYHFTSVHRWHAIADADELTAGDKLTNDPNVPLTDGTRVRITVRMRRDARRFVTVGSERWYAVVDRVDDSIAWERPMRVCSVSRSMVLTPPPTCAGMTT
jgi:hypothetical protein